MSFRLSSLFLAVCLVLPLGGCQTFMQPYFDKAGNLWKYGSVDRPPTEEERNPPEKREVWCYRTLAAIDCYPTIQPLPPEALVSVDPPALRPLTRDAYAKALAAAQEKQALQDKPVVAPKPVIQQGKKSGQPIPLTKL